MQARLRAFRSDECGAVTVDWVVLSAAVIGIGMLFLVPIAFSADSASRGVGDTIAQVGSAIDALN